MIQRLDARLRSVWAHYVDNERGQDVLTWLVVLVVLWLLFSGSKLVVQ